MKMLFICRANVGRSQMAATLFSKMAPEHVAISAGTSVVDKEGNTRDGQKLKDLPAAAHVIACLAEEGIDAQENARQQLTPAMVANADRIIVMAELETIPEYLQDSPKAVYWNITDPKGADLEAHRATRDIIRTMITKLISSL